jgi:high-affinity Fe2+/Pb2+ permease
MIEIHSMLIGVTTLSLALAFVYFLYYCSSGANENFALGIVTILLIVALVSSLVAQIELREAEVKAAEYMSELKKQDCS